MARTFGQAGLWPIVRTHDQAYCYRQECQRIIGPGQPSGFAPGHGAYVAHCPDCDRKTYYDVTSEATGGDVTPTARERRAFARHQAADPHCTCNDCIDDFSRRSED